MASALRQLVDQLGASHGPSPSGMASWQQAVQNVPQRKPEGQQMADLLAGVSLPLSAVPVVGDVAGLGADAAMYATDPESRTLGNFGMTALSAFPFVPNAAAYRLAQKGLNIVEVPLGDKFSDGVEYFLEAPDGKSAAFMHVQPTAGKNQMESLDTQVYPNYQGQNVASDMYDAIQIMRNMDMVPSSVLTKDGANFWASRDPELLRDLLSKGHFVEDVVPNVENALMLAGKKRTK